MGTSELLKWNLVPALGRNNKGSTRGGWGVGAEPIQKHQQRHHLHCQWDRHHCVHKFRWSWAVVSPDAPQKPLVRKRACSGGVRWVQVHEPGSQAKHPRTAGSQQSASTHQEHQILTTAEAASFASQFWDRKVHPTKASQLATCLDVDLEKNVERGNNDDDSDSE